MRSGPTQPPRPPNHPSVGLNDKPTYLLRTDDGASAKNGDGDNGGGPSDTVTGDSPTAADNNSSLNSGAAALRPNDGILGWLAVVGSAAGAVLAGHR